MKSFPSCQQFFFSKPHRLTAIVAAALACASIALAGPVHDAARKGDLNKVKALLQSDPKLVSDVDSKGDTPLHVAALHGELAVAQALLDAGADVNVKNHYGAFTPGDLGGVLWSNNHGDPVVLLNVKGVDQKDMQNGYTPLDLAMFSIRHKQMVALLVEIGRAS